MQTDSIKKMRTAKSLAILALIFSLFVLFSLASSYQVDLRTVAETKCSAAEGIDNISVEQYPGEVTLNGTVVKSLDCDRLDQYSYPEVHRRGYNSGSSLKEFALVMILPVTVILLSGALIGRKYLSSRLEILKLAGIALSGPVAGISLLQLFILSNTMTGLLQLFPFLVGLLFPSLVAYNMGDETDGKIRAVLAFIFNIGYIWFAWSLIFLLSQPLVV